MADESAILPAQAPRALVLVNEFFSGEDLEVLDSDTPTASDWWDDLNGETTEGTEEGSGLWNPSGGGWTPTAGNNYIWYDLGAVATSGFFEVEIQLQSCPQTGTEHHFMIGVENKSIGFTVNVPAPSFRLRFNLGDPPNAIGFANFHAPSGIPGPDDGDNVRDCTTWGDPLDWIRLKAFWNNGEFGVLWNGVKRKEWTGPDTQYRYICIGGSNDNGEVPPLGIAYRNARAGSSPGVTQGLWGVYGTDWFVWDDPFQRYPLADPRADGRYHHPDTQDGENLSFNPNWRKPPMLKDLERQPPFGNPQENLEMVGRWWSEYMEIVNPNLYNRVENGEIEMPDGDKVPGVGPGPVI